MPIRKKSGTLSYAPRICKNKLYFQITYERGPGGFVANVPDSYFRTYTLGKYMNNLFNSYELNNGRYVIKVTKARHTEFVKIKTSVPTDEGLSINRSGKLNNYDGIQGFWILNILLHPGQTGYRNELMFRRHKHAEWITKSKTTLIQKDHQKENAPSNYKLISAPNSDLKNTTSTN